ncbi:MAG: hypothetical protein J5710_04065 [Treponema sp.]|nr:hypothetical protein [Treponema sp.]
MNEELLLPDTVAAQMQKRLVQLETTLGKLKEIQKNMPKGHLRIAQKGTKRPWFYHYTSSHSPTGKYIRKKDTAFAKELAQKDYNAILIEQLKKEIAALQKYLTQSQNGHAIQKFYESLCPVRRTLITPATLTNQQYIVQWKNIIWQGCPFTQDTPTYDTVNGEQVRSKSEVIIADALLRHDIPYRYEFPLELKNGNSNITYYPDFTCLNVHTRQEFIWEHFGLMDDPDYAKKRPENFVSTQKTEFYPAAT